ncbi:MAG: TonB-dependent receptor [Polyangiaceae bacterium]
MPSSPSSPARRLLTVALVGVGALSLPRALYAQDGVPRGEGGAVKKPAEETQPPPGQPVPPRLVKFVPPEHPQAAVEAGVEAQVVLELVIDERGKVSTVTVVDGGPKQYPFAEAATAAAKQLEFEPARDASGKATPARILYRFTFDLEEKDSGTQAPITQGLSGTVVAAANDAGKAKDSAATEVPVAGATLTLKPRDGSPPRTVVAGEAGEFDFGELTVGTYDVSIRAPGYSDSDLVEEVTAGVANQVKYRLFIASGGVEIIVRGERPPREVVKRTVSKREIDRIPGTNGDALRSLQNLPGVARPPAIAGLLIVRGSGPQDTQTFIDGTPVPLIYHFGGLSSVVPTEVLDRIDFYPGNFGAEYGRVMGGIVDVGLRSPKDDGYHGLIQTDLIDARALVEGPIKDGWTFLAAGRRSYVDAWLGPTLEAAGAGVTQAPVYYDYQLFIEHNSPKAGRFRFGFFGSDDSLELLVQDPSPGEPALSGNLGLHTAFQRLQVLYERDITAVDRARAVMAFGHDDLGFSFGPLFFNLNVFSFNTRFEYAHTFSKAVRLNAGFDIFSAWAEVNLRLPEQNARPGEPPNQPFSTRPFVELSTSVAGTQSAIYPELALEPLPTVRIVPGVRLDYFSVNDEFNVSPRISGRFGLHNEFPRTTLKAGVGMYHQPPQFQQVVEPLGTSTAQANRAIHYALGLEQEITQNLDFSVEGFVKQFDNLVTGQTTATGLSYNNVGLGYAVGGEFLLRYKPDERFFGWIAYTISRSVRQNSPSEPEYLVSFDQTHILTILGSYQLGHGWEVGARLCGPSRAT